MGKISPLTLLFLLICLACSPAPEPVLPLEKKHLADGKWVEQRIRRFFNRRVEEVYFVYLDSVGNFVKHGSDTHYYMTSQIKFSEQYRDGKLEGISEFWYPNGAKQWELTYNGDRLNGKALTWYPNGKRKTEKNWMDGRLHGVEMEWNKMGKKIKEIQWNHNAIEPVQKFQIKDSVQIVK